MFPQSELDNYKLQVELLQEKLQRSEISRQHLEHKLDKILHKRDEHDKVVRSKAKQKYQQFLEEQQKRNERNKQLVQMLEHIEHQTEAMNARSERLKMMKLQYEMYFAKLVHSQTRRCIQNSVPATVTPMMPASATLTRPMEQTMMPAPATVPASSVMEGYNYTNDINPRLMTTSYRRYNVPIDESEQFLRSQIGHVPSSTNMEMPSLANFKPSDRNEYMDLRNSNSNPSMQQQQQQPYEFQPRQQTNQITRDFVENCIDSSFGKMERDPKLYTSTPKANEHKPNLVKTNSFTKDTQYKELDKVSPTMSNTNTSFNNDRMPNTNSLSALPINLTQSSSNSSVSSAINNVVPNNKMKMFNEPKTSNQNQETNNSTDISQQDVSRDFNSSLLPQDFSREIQNVEARKSNEIKPLELIKPIMEDYVPKTYEIEHLQPIEQMPETVIHATSKIDSNETTNLPFTPINNTLDSNSSTTPVSIEKIENAIYGELLTPLETTAPKEQQINSSLTPKLLENLVTQADNIVEEDISLKESKGKQPQQIDPDNTSTNYENAAISNDYEQQPQLQNYDETTAYDYNTQPNDATTANYAAYENVENPAIDGNPEQQQYDYSNYDPSQYSYPGYIYDETTGEYKPDPNATVDQYATDQQYAAENYDPQQYQQQEGYDYNQTYAQDQDPSSSATADSVATYENYDTTQPENITNSPQLNDDAQSIQPQLEVEPIVQQPETELDTVTEDLTQIPAKITKPTSILAAADKNEAQKKKKRVNFVDSSETDESVADKVAAPATAKATVGNTGASSESDFDFSSSTDTAGAPQPT